MAGTVFQWTCKSILPPEVTSFSEVSAEVNVNCKRQSKGKEKKAAGPDNAPPDALKADPNLSTDILCGLFGKI